MIWQLMKRNPVWQIMPAALALLVGTALFGRGQGSPVPVVALAFGSILTAFPSHCTLYEAALPIETMDLWLSQVVSLLGMLWLPVLGASVVLVAKGADPIPVLAAAAFYTLILAAMKRVWAGRFSVPQWVRWIGFLTIPVVIGVAETVPHAGRTLAICGVASAALFTRDWMSVPRSFQIAPAEARKAGQWRESGAHVRWAWSPVLRSIHGWGIWITLVVCTQMHIGVLAIAIFFVPVLFQKCQQTRRWLAPLPLHARTLFRMLTLPFAAGIVAASAMGVMIDGARTLRIDMVEMASQLAVMWFLLLLYEVIEWRRPVSLPKLVRLIPVCAAYGLVFVATIHRHKPYGILDEWTRRGTEALPQNWFWFACALAAPVAVIYWMAQSTFAETEYPRALVTLQWPAGGPAEGDG